MVLLSNDWRRVREHYARFHAEILRAGCNEWGTDPYAWDEGLIFLTPIETWLWAEIRACDAVLYPQFPIGRFFVDFANPAAKVAIECDGAAYHTDKAKDARRDAELQALGWTVYRISGSDCAQEGYVEPGVPGAARLFIARICEAHGISRNTRTREEDEASGMDDWSAFGDWWPRSELAEAAAKRGTRP